MGQRNDRDKQKCYNCGNEGHIRAACPSQDRGKKCYNCDFFGHISKDCRKPERERGDPKTASINIIEQDNEEDMLLTLKFQSGTARALLDTGSPYTVMTRSVYRRLRLPGWQPTTVSMKGFAGQREAALGELQITFTVQNEEYELRCIIVENGLMSYEMMVGRNILKVARILIDDGVPKIEKKVVPLEENEIMMIEPIINETRVELMENVLPIENEDKGLEIIKMNKGYAPKAPKEEALKMEIVMTDEIPIHQNPRRLAPMEREVVQEMVEEFLNDGTTNFPQPKNEKAVQSFLGLTGFFFRKFINKYAVIARPLTQLMKADTKFKFSREEIEAFATLKNKVKH